MLCGLAWRGGRGGRGRRVIGCGKGCRRMGARDMTVCGMPWQGVKLLGEEGL